MDRAATGREAQEGLTVRRAATLLAAALLVLVAAGCDTTWAPIGGRQPCGVDAPYKVNPKGFTLGQIFDIGWAFDSVRAFSHVRYTFAGFTDDTVDTVPRDATVIRVEKHVAVDRNGQRRWGVTTPNIEAGKIHGGTILLDPNADQARTGIPFGAAGWDNRATYLKVVVHEIGHMTGLNDVASMGNLMGNIYLNGYGAGDLLGLAAVGCPV